MRLRSSSSGVYQYGIMFLSLIIPSDGYDQYTYYGDPVAYCKDAKVIGLPYADVNLDWSVPLPSILISEGHWESQNKSFKGPTARGIRMSLGTHDFAMRVSLGRQYGPEYFHVGAKTCHRENFRDRENCKIQAFYGGLLPDKHYGSSTTEYPFVDPFNRQQDEIFGKGNLTAVQKRDDVPSVKLYPSEYKNLELSDNIIEFRNSSYWVENSTKTTSNGTEERLTLGEYDERAFINMGDMAENILRRLQFDRYLDYDSASWGFFSGWRSADYSTLNDGMLVLGGYDASKLDRSTKSHTYALGTGACRLPIKIREMLLFRHLIRPDLKEPTNINFTLEEFGPGNYPPDYIEGCIDPELDGIMMPGIYRAYTALSRAFPTGKVISDKSSSYTPSFFRISKQDMDRDQMLTDNPVRLQRPGYDATQLSEDISAAGMEINIEWEVFTIPVHQLFAPEQILTPVGYRTNHSNDSLVVSFSYPPPVYENMVVLGMQFLSNTYLTVSPETNTFTLHPVRRDLSPDKPVELVPLLYGEPCTIYTAKEGVSWKEGSAILGATLGVIAVVGSCILFKILRSRFRSKAPIPPAAMGLEIDGKDKDHPEKDGISRSEVHGLSRLEAFGVQIYQKGDSDIPRAHCPCCRVGLHELDGNSTAVSSRDFLKPSGSG